MGKIINYYIQVIFFRIGYSYLYHPIIIFWQPHWDLRLIDNTWFTSLVLCTLDNSWFNSLVFTSIFICDNSYG
ncbi:hypothetical protein U3516DRAFT_906291 [Neocallimastix sp. 'constans']